MRHGVLPKTLHVDEPTPHVDWSAGAVELLTEARPWAASEGPRRAGVSSFGVSGTNAHVIVEEAPEAEPVPMADPVLRSDVLPLVLSGRDDAGLRAVADQVAGVLAREPLPDVAWSLLSRPVLDRRAVVLAADRDAALAGLAGIEPVEPGSGRAVFVFPGQGWQWAGMTAGLLDASSVFAEAMAECERALGVPVIEILRSGAELERVDVVQPVLFAVMVSLARLWRACGAEPKAVVGHSQGEVAAACVAGVLSLEDAARVVVARSRAVAEVLSGKGGMAVARMPLAEAEKLIANQAVEIAAVNGPSQIVLSGAVDDLLGDERVRRIGVDYASHCAQVEAIRDRLLAELADITPRQAEVPMWSTVTGGWVRGGELDADYWYANLRNRVRFGEAIDALTGDGFDAFIEVSAHPVLAQAIEHPHVIPTLRRDSHRFIEALAGAHTAGIEVDWRTVVPPAREIDLPTYPFQRERYWPAHPEAVTDAWRHRIEWVPVELTPGELGERWAVVSWAGSGEAAGVLAGELRSAGAEVVELAVAADADRDALRRSWIEAAGGGPVTGVVSFLAADGGGGEAGPGVPRGVWGSLLLAQALADTGTTTRMWWVTRGAVHTRAPDPAAAMTWGLGRVVALELPGVWGGLVDLDATGVAGVVPVLGGAGEDEVAVRDGRPWARRLVPVPHDGGADGWRPRGTVLVTGGLGAVGRRVVRWLADEGAEHVVLLHPEAVDVSGLAPGTRVSPLVCDITDPEAVRSAVAGLGETVSGVVHMGGEARLRPVAETGLDDLVVNARVKVLGARNLDAACPDAAAFVLFFSVAAVWGGSAHGAYAAAGAYMEALAEERRSRGLAATSIAWGVWDAFDDEDQARAAETSVRQGLTLLDPDLAVAELGRGGTARVIADVAWETFLPLYTSARPSRLFDRVPRARRAPEPPGEEAANDLALRLAGLPETARRRELLTLVRAHVARVLRRDEPDAIADDQSFKELGFDSLTAVELRNGLSAAVGRRLAATMVFDHPTPGDLAAYLHAELLPDDVTGAASIHSGLDRLAGALAEVPLDPAERAGVEARLRTLLAAVAADRSEPGDSVADRLDAASDDEVLDFIRREFGGPVR
ncbi:acyltransferase domain-containing protein [Thermocatellispora tengchongensis]